MSGLSGNNALRRKWIAFCLSLPGAYEDYPFSDSNWTVMRHHENAKTFALIYERGGQMHINVKCEPLQAAFFRQVYPAVTPGYHMNKTHWNTLTLDGSIPVQELQGMIVDSFRLTAPPQKRS